MQMSTSRASLPVARNANRTFRCDREIVLAAVAQNGRAPPYASETFNASAVQQGGEKFAALITYNATISACSRGAGSGSSP